ncbi:MAG: CYTH domain-containing protein [Chloroflexi bacterium]|nr:MAG: CYTH domain-containing protein [Chloroflexota bacterium]
MPRPGSSSRTAPGLASRASEGSTPSTCSRSSPWRGRDPASLPPMLEREIKLGVTPGFELPPLDRIAEGVVAAPAQETRLETVYYDTPDLRLARWGCSLRFRQRQGWTLKLPQPSDGPALVRRELEFPGDGSRPPEAATALVQAYVRRSSLVPVATLSTMRKTVQLKNGGRRRLSHPGAAGRESFSRGRGGASRTGSGHPDRAGAGHAEGGRSRRRRPHPQAPSRAGTSGRWSTGGHHHRVGA